MKRAAIHLAPDPEAVRAALGQLRAQYDALAGKSDHFSRRELARLDEVIRKLEAGLPAPDEDPHEAAPPPAPEEGKQDAPAEEQAAPRCRLLDPEIAARAKEGRRLYWARRREEKAQAATKAQEPRRPRTPRVRSRPAEEPLERPAHLGLLAEVEATAAQALPVQPPAQHWEVYVGPPRQQVAERRVVELELTLTYALARLRGMNGERFYADDGAGKGLLARIEAVLSPKRTTP